MKRVVFDRVGPPAEVLRLEDDVPAPQPKWGEVLVRMLASPVNPSDLMYIGGKYGLKPNLPATPGFEGVGVVEATGGGVLGWLRKGKRVAVINDGRGTWAEYTVTKARQVIPVPDGMSDEQAASFFVNPATALAMTQDVLKVPKGAWLLQSAAGGELGKMVVRLGHKFAFRTINVVRRREQVDELKKLGADHVVVESDGPVPEQVRKLVPDGVRYALDPVGGETGSQIIAALSHGGRCLLYGSLTDQPVSAHPRHLIGNDVHIEGFWLGTWAKQQRILTMLGLFRRVRALMAEGVLQTHFSGTYPLEEVNKAVDHAAQPGKGGKVLIRIGVR
ncbi:Alcohol dehydrogenase [Gemmata obscuriglobus]|uniref:enoyl-[acyl-carrier-protein] reductase n=1 Tax=Gemmata obscuriglobus TaxID=114 RepID=A0A2Z3HGD1_9BACT|nr:zinc-dependent alcohol dehydrogenase family protein [Gemmata obscuriglobus]AWM40460.1 zinc-binding dehydrogenase [Gemmata obscuriglobus]QEG26296.1 Alcohol dehydrogenase [Gemmata obscuriglobus]VTS01177.1 alcohol dehydrogenase : Zn-dependent oxidoreductase, NADPH:quinone reductase OS=Singulisphaera acidiphila (strain ATCC BAA-1392 / DSM 18658 / VKM B-2454 / MOB10) GN=Sinac_6319 PE=4 SV=1: ADH_N: ADH_zinc_N [Gemmata obscuriglobus UQM 2246]